MGSHFFNSFRPSHLTCHEAPFGIFPLFLRAGRVLTAQVPPATNDDAGISFDRADWQ